MTIDAAHAFFCLVKHNLTWNHRLQTFRLSSDPDVKDGLFKGEIGGYPAAYSACRAVATRLCWIEFPGRTVMAVNDPNLYTSAWQPGYEPTDAERIIIRFLCEEDASKSETDPHWTQQVDWLS